jgi:FG-GAP-like repeat
MRSFFPFTSPAVLCACARGPAQVHAPAHGKPAAAASAAGLSTPRRPLRVATALKGCRRSPGQDRTESCKSESTNGDGTFTDVTKSSGIANHLGKAWGVVATDVNNDGKIDLFVANDTMANFLFMNRDSGKFEEIGALSGVVDVR